MRRGRSARRLAGVALLTLPLAASRADLAAPPIVLDLPVACTLGTTCVIQQYFDHDRGPGAVDYHCGPMVYDGHDGTDFRVPSAADQRRGVDVNAAASGRVVGVRDAMADVDVRLAGTGSVAGRECGNGATIAHADGWETQYCHLARGSLRVRSGDVVAAGAVIGQVGESGEAAFPHLHLSVRHRGVKVDPFAASEPAAACGRGASLWSATAARALAYRSPDVLNAGFAGGPVTLVAVEAGAVPPPGAHSDALVAYVRVIGLAAGDVPELTLAAADGTIVARSILPPFVRNRAEQLLTVGTRQTGVRWTGRYTGRIIVRRGAAVALDRGFTTTIG